MTQKILVELQISQREVKLRVTPNNHCINHVMIQSQLRHLIGAKVVSLKRQVVGGETGPIATVQVVGVVQPISMVQFKLEPGPSPDPGIWNCCKYYKLSGTSSIHCFMVASVFFFMIAARIHPTTRTSSASSCSPTLTSSSTLSLSVLVRWFLSSMVHCLNGSLSKLQSIINLPLRHSLAQ